MKVLGWLIQLAADWWAKKHGNAVASEVNATQDEAGEIERLIKQYHFGSTPERRQEALEELRRRGAMI